MNGLEAFFLYSQKTGLKFGEKHQKRDKNV
jgi:hypothetical protein